MKLLKEIFLAFCAALAVCGLVFCAALAVCGLMAALLLL